MMLLPLSKKLLWRCAGILLCAGLSGVTAFAASSLTQFGITWNFDRDYPSGQFANGDHWVVGPVKITSITPRSTTSGGVTMHGSVINPVVNSSQGYDSRIKNNPFSDALNVARAFPLTVQPGSSVVSSESYSAYSTGDNPQLKTIAILTVLSAPAPSGSFRPPYVAGDKSLRWNRSQLKYGSLRSLPVVAGTPSLTSVEQSFERPWIEQKTNWTGRYVHPGANQPTYGREIAHSLANGLLSLQLNYSAAQKEKLLIRMVQYGIDVYGVTKSGGRWNNDGGHNQGRKMPMLLAGVVLGDADILRYADARQHFGFQEDQSTWFVTQSDVGRVLYTADGRLREQYIQSDVGVAEWGEKHTGTPNRDGRNWNAYYRDSAGVSTVGHVLTARLMGLESNWNWPATFAYYDRFYKNEAAQSSYGVNTIQPFVKSMWVAYRNATPPKLDEETVATNIWENKSLPVQTGSFTVAFDMMPSADKMDGVTGLSNGAADAYAELAAAVRFAPTGYIDAMNGSAFGASAAVAYKAGVKYHVAMSVNVATKRYSVKVTPAGGATVTLAENWQFRSEQTSVTALNNLAFFSASGNHAVLDVGIEAASAPAPAPAPIPAPTPTPTPIPEPAPATTLTASKTWANAALSAQTGSFGVTFDLVPSGNKIDSITGVSNGAADDYSDLAAAVRFAPSGYIDARNGSGFKAASAVPYKAGVSYRVVMNVNLATKRYSATVTPAGGATITVADNWMFRSEQSKVTLLSNIGAYAGNGGHTVSNVAVAGEAPALPAPTPAPAPAPVPVPAPAPAPAPATGIDLGITKTSHGAWQNASVPSVTGKAVFAFDMVPARNPMDGATALTCGPADAFSDFAVAVRFAPNGQIDAINGSSWNAATALRYVAGQTYQVVMTIDVVAHRYSVTVTPAGGSPVVIASNWAFRTTQSKVKALDNLTVIAPYWRHTVSNVSFE